MAVIVQYIVVRDGDEKMTFATKKEADAYDKMLDIADNLFDFLGQSSLNLNETLQEEICLLMAEKRDEVMPILRGVSPKAGKATPKAGSTAKAAAKSAAPAKPTAPAKPAATAAKQGASAAKKATKPRSPSKAATARKSG